MIALFTALLVLIAAYAGWSRLRHVRLKADCVAAFELAYAETSARPAFEMAYSYGEPVFEVRFASRSEMAAAAAANAAFLDAIDAVCANRGRKRQFKAQRSVSFRHPQEGEPVVRHCCDAMRAHVGREITYSENARAYGLRTPQVGTPPLTIAHCPWCGSSLPSAA